MNARTWMLAAFLATGCAGASAEVGASGEGACAVVEDALDAAELRLKVDAAGRMIELASASGEWAMEWAYRADGQPVRSSERSAAGVRRTVTTYDADGRAVAAEAFSGEERTSLTTFEHPFGAEVREAMDTDLDGHPDQIRLYTHDALGRWTERTTLDRDGTIVGATRRRYDGDSQRVTEEVTSGSEGEILAIVENGYDADGRMVRERVARWDAGREVSVRQVETTYDASLRPLRRVATESGRLVSDQRYTWLGTCEAPRS